MKSKHFRPYEREQSLLLPQNLSDWLPEGHLVFFVRDVVDQLDLGPILADCEVGKGGYPPYDPRMMVRLLLYACRKGVASYVRARDMSTSGRDRDCPCALRSPAAQWGVRVPFR